MSDEDQFCKKSQSLYDLLAIADMGFWDLFKDDRDVQIGNAELDRLYGELQAEAGGISKKEKLIKTVKRPLKKSNYARAAHALTAASRILEVCDVQPSFEMFVPSRTHIPPYGKEERLAVKKKLLGHLFEEDSEFLITGV